MVGILFLTWLVVAALQIAAWPRITADRRWRLGALAAVLALCVAHQLMFATLAEDAFISFRYAMNLAQGNGFVFNTGERVEGYSNFLWVLLIALPNALFNADIVLVARMLGVACTLGCVVLAYLLAKRITGSGAAGVLAATITAASGSLAAYGPSGLETPLFALLVLAAMLAVQARWMLAAGVVVALATMTRPDGLVIVAVLGGWLIIQVLRNRDRWRSPILFAAGGLVLAVPWTAWRVAYYGHLLPNALAAKSGMALDEQLDLGWKYLAGFLAVAQAVLVLVPLAVFAVITRRDRIPQVARSLVWLLFAVVGVYVAFFTVAGGDWMPAWRFFAPAMPLVAVALATTWALTSAAPDSPEPMPLAGRLAPTLVATASVLLLLASVYHGSMRGSVNLWRSQLYEMSSMGAWVSRTLPAGTAVATYANGALSYEAGPELTMIDVLGLTDEHIARRGKRLSGAAVGHAAHDYDYVVTVRKPDVVFMRGAGFSLLPACDRMPELVGQGHYRSVVFQVAGRQRWAPLYVRSERADTIIAMLDTDPEFDLVPCPP